MDCRSYAELLDRFESDALSPAERRAAAAHREDCARCRKLHQAVRGHAAPEVGEPPRELVMSILQQTSGPVCGSARKRLCDWVDGGLDENERQILSIHLEHCEDCSALASSLVELRQVLPEMASLEPDIAFAGQVLQATLSRPQRAGIGPDYADLRGWWHRLARRPRIAWEAAYVGALLILLMIGNAPLPRSYFQSAALVPLQIMQRSNRLIDTAADSLAERRQAALLALKGLQQRGRSVMEDAIGMQARTRQAIREKSSELLSALESELWSAENPDLP